MALRVTLIGRIVLEAGEVVVDEQRLQGRQGRLLLAYLVLARGRPVPRDELADLLWAETPPATWEKALSVLVSKLRAVLGECDDDGAGWLTSAFGCYQLSLPEGTWVDVQAAADEASAAEQSLLSGAVDDARASATAAATQARGTFLPGETAPWVDERRSELRAILVRALECLARIGLAAGDPGAAARAAEEVVVLEPFREGGYRLLMQAQAAAGNDAEALRTYERCRTLIAEELGAFPSAETEAVYLEILRGTGAAPEPPPAREEQTPAAPPDRPADDMPPEVRRPRRRIAALVVALLAAGAAAAAATAVGWREDHAPVVRPNSVVRLDVDSGKPTMVVPIGDAPDIVVPAGGYVWVTHHVLRDTESIGGLRYAGKRILTRVDPSTGEATVVGGGLAPCGLAADPSGDVWVANCYLAVSGPHPAPTIVRLDAETLAFEETFRVAGGDGFFRALAYGGGWLWASDIRGGDLPRTHAVSRIDPASGVVDRIPLTEPSGPIAWSGAQGDLWLSNFPVGTVSRLDVATGDVRTTTPPIPEPAFVAVSGDDAWIGNWGAPVVMRMRHADLAPDVVELPARSRSAGVWWLASGAGSVWATTPRDHSLWRIDPRTQSTTRIDIPYLPTCVAVDEDSLWVTVRGS